MEDTKVVNGPPVFAGWRERPKSRGAKDSTAHTDLLRGRASGSSSGQNEVIKVVNEKKN